MVNTIKNVRRLFMGKSNVPGVEKSERDEKRKIESEQKEHTNRVYLNELNLKEKKAEVEQKEAPVRIDMDDIKQLKEKKWIFEQIQLMKHEISKLAKEQELQKVQIKELMEILNEALNMIETEEERNDKKVEEVEEIEEEKTIKEKLEDHVRKELQKTSLFSKV